jgi:predicted TIM-barrel fold metal-dependent hydrolase
VEEQIRCLRQYAARVAPFGWTLQTYHPHPEYYESLSPVIRELPVPVVVDHFGGLKTASLLRYQGLEADTFDAASQPGLAALCSLLRDGKLWIKLSAPYRCSEDPTFEDMRPLVRALVDANPDRVLYGSDWPHTQPFHRRPKDLKGSDVETYLPFDDVAWVNKLKTWLSQDEWGKLMISNPRAFTGYDRDN